MTHRETLLDYNLIPRCPINIDVNPLPSRGSTLKSQQGLDIPVYVYSTKPLLEHKTLDTRAFNKNKKKLNETKFVAKKMKILAKRVSRNHNNGKGYTLKPTFSDNDREYL